MQTVEFNGWVLEVDQSATEGAYAKVEVGGALECGCSDCLRFDAARMDLLPSSTLALFEQLGVDSTKEVEVANFGPDDEGRDIWSWWYHFIGRLVSIPDSAEFNGQIAFTPLTVDFSIGFAEQATLVRAPFQDHGSVVQIECFYYESDASRSTKEASAPSAA